MHKAKGGGGFSPLSPPWLRLWVCPYNHKLQKPSKESGVFQSLGTIRSFLLKGKVKKRGAMAQYLPPKYASGAMSVVNDQTKTVVEGVLRVCISPAG